MFIKKTKLIISQVLVCFVSFTNAQIPKSIISVSPSITKQIYLLEKGNLLIACSSYCKLLDNKELPIIATEMDVNVEKIFILKPDLVLASDITNIQSINSLKQLGIKVKIIPLPKSFKEICTSFLDLGQCLGAKEKAQIIINNTNGKLDSLKQLISNNNKPKIFIEIGAKPLFTSIPNTFMHDYIKYSGGISIVNDLEIGSITRESVLMRNPNVILIVTMGILGQEEKQTWQQYPTLNAAKNNKIFILDADISCSPDPISFIETIQKIIELIY